MKPGVTDRSNADEIARVGADTAGLGDYALACWRHRWLVVGFCVAGLVTAFGITLNMPRMYESTATVLAPKEGVGGGLLGGLAVSALTQQIPGLSVPSLTPNRDMLVSVLKSRSVAQAVSERFRLQERYQVQYLQDAIGKLQRDVTNISMSREGVIAVRVEDRDPELAAAIANFYVEQLDRIVSRFNTGEAGRQRGFISEQLARAKSDLERAEESLRHFQEKNRAIVLQEQTRTAVEAVARLKGEMMAAEIQLNVLRNFATEANPEMVALRRRIDEMGRQLTQMQYGDRAGLVPREAAARDRRDFSVPFTRVPEVGLELARLTRDVKIQETLVTLLTQQGEQAKLVEARDIPVVQVLDRAVPGERPSKPRLTLNLAVGVATSLFSAMALAILIDHFRSSSRRRSRT